MPLTEEEKKERKLAYQRKYYKENKTECDSRNKLWNKNNRAKRNNYTREYEKSNPEWARAVRRRTKTKDRLELRDPYIKKLLRQNTILRDKDIPQSLIEAKRIEIKMKHYFKEQENG